MSGSADEPRDDVGALGDEARAYLAEAQRVAEDQFGPATAREIPLLVTQTAMLMATIAGNRSSEEI